MSPLDFGLTKAAYSVNEALQLLPWGRTTFYDEIKQGKLRVCKRGKNTLVLAPDLVDYLVRLRNESICGEVPNAAA